MQKRATKYNTGAKLHKRRVLPLQATHLNDTDAAHSTFSRSPLLIHAPPPLLFSPQSSPWHPMTSSVAHVAFELIVVCVLSYAARFPEELAPMRVVVRWYTCGGGLCGSMCLRVGNLNKKVRSRLHDVVCFCRCSLPVVCLLAGVCSWPCQL
jgi:hypothetical protein